MIINKYKIREQNEALVLKAIIDNKNISRAEVANLTGLNKASVSSITKSLMEDNLIRETGIGSASSVGGRKPIMLEFNPTAASVLAIDLGTNYVKSSLSYLNGMQTFYYEEKNIIVSKNTVLLLIEKMITKIEIEAPEQYYNLVGATFAIHGIVDNNQIIFTPNYDLDEINLLKHLSAKYSFPIFLENEANLSALAEYAVTDKVESLVSISIHSGVGSGIIEHGRIQKGQHGEAGEIGHSTIFPHGLPCPCGNHGCLERYTSKSILYENIMNKLDLTKLNSDLVAELFQNKLIDDEINDNSFLLSVGINNLITMYDPEIVIINSSIYEKIPEAVNLIQKNLTGSLTKKVKIKNSSLGYRSTLFGGIVLATQNFLNIQALKFK